MDRVSKLLSILFPYFVTIVFAFLLLNSHGCSTIHGFGEDLQSATSGYVHPYREAEYEQNQRRR